MVPIKVELFLIVNPPAWFGVIWKIMKPMLAPSFRRKVKICNESQLEMYLQCGYEKHLPDDFESGKASTQRLVDDFITYRRYVERDYNDEATTAMMGRSGNTELVDDEYDDDDLRSRHSSDADASSVSHSLDTSLDMGCGDNLAGDFDDDNDDDDASIHADIDGMLDEHMKEMDDYLLDCGW
jgi:CRAL/TRIO domain